MQKRQILTLTAQFYKLKATFEEYRFWWTHHILNKVFFYSKSTEWWEQRNTAHPRRCI